MRHFVTLTILELQFAEDIINAFRRRVLSKASRDAVFGIIRDLLACDNLPDLILASKKVSKAIGDAEKAVEAFANELTEDIKDAGLEGALNDLVVDD